MTESNGGSFGLRESTKVLTSTFNEEVNFN